MLAAKSTPCTIRRLLTPRRFTKNRKEAPCLGADQRPGRKRKFPFAWAAWGVLLLGLSTPLNARAPTTAFPVPSIDAGLGPCSVDYTITNQNFQPLYDAQISVHFKYGTWGLKRMDLQVGTDSAGRARVQGLPLKVRHPPLVFIITYRNASEDWFWTGLVCNSQVQLALNVG